MVRDTDASTQTRVFRDLRIEFDAAHEEWGAWGDGELGQLNNALAQGIPIEPSDGLSAMLEEAAQLHESSGGLFEPTIGALTALWGFEQAERPHGPPPSAERIASWLAGRLPVRYDLGAYAKGVAVENAMELLRGAGVRHALINAGGDVSVLGTAGDRPWRIGIRHPRGPGIYAGVELHDGEAVFTSGDYERMFEWQGIRYHHILDPRTGYPATATASLTVIHDRPAVADAAATALFVAGEDWPTIAAAMKVTYVMRVLDNGAVELSPAMAERLHFEIRPPSVTVRDYVVQTR